MATSRSFHRNQRLHMRRWAAIAAAALMISTLFALFGARVASAVGDLTIRVYTDSVRNGQYDPGEPGVSGVPVAVYNTDNNLSYLVNTDSNGLATFPSIPNGDYRVEVANPNNGLPNGTVISLPGSTTPGQDNALVFFVTINSAPVQRYVGLRSLDASGIDTSAPAGYRTIVVRAWDDLDANGIQDAGEPGIDRLTLGLYNPSNGLVATATTGPDGTYRFVDSVPANVSNYTIRVTGGIPAGYVLTTQNANFDSEDRRDSDAQLVAGEPRITVPSQARGVNDDSLDIGFSRGAVSGFVWRDLDQNGLRDPGEPFINGVTVELLSGSTPIMTETTRSILNDPFNRAGFFEFTSVPLTATYRVRIPSTEFDQSTDLLFGHATPQTQTVSLPQIGNQGLRNGTDPGPVVIDTGDFLQTPDFTLNATNRRNETSNFGLYAGTVGDFVWHDVNRNGIVDPLETTLGLANALVFIDLNSDCLINTGELTTTTDLNGYYLFDSLPLGVTYTVVLDASNFAPGGALEGLGYTTGAPCGSTEGVVITTTLLTANTPADFGVDFGIARAEIGNFVWEDNNGDGIFNLSESGVPSVTVQLYGAGPDGIFFTADDVTVGVSQTTNASGIYTITDIISGTYYATFDLSLLPPAYVASVYTPTGWLSVDPLANNSDDVNDVRAFVSGRVWRTPTFTITRGSQNPGVDAAVFQPASLSGRVFFDQNGNNQDETSPEPGLVNFTVNLRRASDNTLVMTTTTVADGSYTFSSVAPLTYVVEIVRPDPTNWSFVTPDVPSAGDPLASDVDANGRTGVILVTSGATVTEVDAGLRGNNIVQGRVFYDRDGSFTQTGNDQDLSGATATLTVTVATVNLTTTYTLTATTGAGDPNYSFTGIPGGTSGVTYTLTFAPPDATYTPSLADVGGNDALDSDGPFIQVTGATVGVSNTLDYDQGYWRPVTVRARIFDEITNLPPDNVYNVGDTGITTATVTITTTNGTVTPLSSSGIDSTGVVTFTLPPTTTTYWLNVLTPAGFTRSPGNTGALEVNTPNPLLADNTAPSPTTEFQFGYFRPGTVTGTVRFDRDADNDLFADDEPGMQGVTVTLRLGGSDVLTTITDATGAYTFTGVLPANGYQVRVINPDPTNFLLVTPAGGDNDLQTLVGDDADTAAFNVAPGATVSGSSDAAVRGRATVTGQVWEDDNGNGQRETGEDASNLPNVPVTLTVTVNLPGLLSTTITTNTVTSGGFYTFTALPGWANASTEVSFTLGFATPSGWFATLPDVGAPATDSDGSGTGPDQLDDQGLQRNTTETRDRGYYRPAVIQVRVFEENPPVDNIYAAGDAPLTATITLTPNVVLSGPSAQDATGIITYTVAPTTTAYVIGVTTPSGYTPSPGNTGTLTVTAPLTSNTTFGPLEFGYFQAGTVTGAVRFDRDGDNVLFADTEPGMQGVTVTLRLGGSDVLTTTTDATGAYTFTNVTPNISYTVRVINPDPTNFLLVTPAGGDNDMATTDGGNTYAETAPFTVTSNAVVGGLSDAAVRGRATVTGQVWEDLNGNGVRETGENVGALPEVTVNLTVTVNLPGLLSTTIAANTTTNASGVYTFTNLPGGASAAEVNFTLRFATPSGWFDTLADVGTQPANDDSDGIGTGVDQLDNQALGRGATETRDRGYYRPAVIQVRVFEETTLPINNVYASGDVPIAGATVTLTPNVTLGGPFGPDATGIITYTVAPTTTTYVIGVTTPAGYTPSPGNTGTLTVTAPLTSNATYGPLEFGYFRPGTVTGAVRFDRDADNILFADNEPGMQGVTVTLWLSNTVVATATTDATGAYTFTNVTPNISYTVRVTNPDTLNFELVTPAGGDNDMATTDGGNTYAETAPFTVTSNAVVGGLSDAAVRGRATVTGQVWEDLNGNGVRETGEDASNLPNVPVTLTVTVNLPGLLSTTITTNTTTNASGFYTFTALPGGASAAEANFTLRFATPSGWFDTLTDVAAGAPNNDSDGIGTGGDQLDDQALGRGATETRDRGYYRPAVIQVRVFEETMLPINNVYAFGDAPITGASVTLTPNVTLGGPFGPDATGIISYTVTPTTTAYTVGVIVPAGYFPSPGNTGAATAPALISGQTITPLPFGYYRNGVISGTVWFDSNVNGTFDTGEPTMAGVTVTLHLDPDATVNGNEALIGTFTTGDNGIYQFTNITPTDVLTTGTLYRVRFELPTGYVFTTQGAPITTDNNSDAITATGYTDRFSVGSNETVTYVDAGAVGNLSLSGTTWEDTDADGTFDAGETGLSGVTLTLTVTTSINSTNPTVTYTVTSGAGSPNFTFNQLPAGNYQLSVIAKPLGYLLSTAGTLSGTLPATGQNFGFYRTAAVGDRVWLDVNGNGTYEAGVDAGLPGITVRLRDAATDVVISTTTTLAGGNAGFYGFENVTPGSYVVEFVVPTGFQTVNNGAGSLSVDNDNDAQSNGRTASFTLASNQISTTVDAGLVGSGSISGIAWIDENFDDIRNPGETQRVAGVKVTLTITPTVLSSPLTLSTTTNASGVYTFTNLPPGTFVLTFTKPAGYFDITPRVGSDPTVDSDAPVATGTLSAGQSITTLDAGYRTQTRVFLPLIMAPATPPDLVVEAFTVTPAKSSYAAGEPVLITVKVKNVGGSPTTIGFWVDLYINPSTPPTTPNVRWNDVCGISPCYGIAWYVNQSLAPGQSITLTSAPGQFAGPQSIWPGSFASGTNALYVYVDSYNPPVPTGAVVEGNETNNRAEITGFVVAGASFSNGVDPESPSSIPNVPVALPPRRAPGPVEP
jgi:hypothetical protein